MTVSTRFASSLPPPPGHSLGSALIPSAAFPVVFFDGNQETDVGSVMVDGTIRYSKLLSNICGRIGVPANQISLYLVRKKKTRTSNGRRKVPIDEGSDFSLLARERDCVLLVKSRRSGRKAKAARRNHVVDGRSPQEKDRAASASATMTKTGAQQWEDTKTILRRPPPELFGTGPRSYESAAMVPLDMEGGGYFMSTSSFSAAPVVDPYLNIFPVNYRRPSYTYDARPFCKICAGGAGDGAPEFHCCSYDMVTSGFRSIFGPIRRPDKRNPSMA